MRLQFLDRLRCIAVLAVVSQHYVESILPENAKTFLNFGPGVFGVVLFFMISGYVVPLSLKTRNEWRTFLIRRGFRILPMYWVTLCLVITMGISGILPYADLTLSASVGDYASNAFLVFEYSEAPAFVGVAWSLSLEFVWYGLFCALLIFGGLERTAWTCLAYSGALMILCSISMATDQRLPFGRLLMLNAALLGYVRYCFDTGYVSSRSFLNCKVIFIFTGGCALWTGFGYFSHPSVSLTSNAFAWTSAYLLFTVICHINLNQTFSRFSMRPVARLDLWSYSIYLLHEPVRHALSFAFSGWPLMLAAFAGTVAASALAYRFVEIPFNRLGHNLTIAPHRTTSPHAESTNRLKPKT